MKRSLFSRKPLEIESLADAQFVIDSCCLVSQASYLSNSDKDCAWFILARFMREQMNADATFPRLGNKVRLKILNTCTRYATQKNLYKPHVRTNTGNQMISFKAIDLWKSIPKTIEI